MLNLNIALKVRMSITCGGGWEGVTAGGVGGGGELVFNGAAAGDGVMVVEGATFFSSTGVVSARWKSLLNFFKSRCWSSLFLAIKNEKRERIWMNFLQVQLLSH